MTVSRDEGETAADRALLLAFERVATTAISDNLSRLPGTVGLRPFHGHGRTMVGRAFTVRTAPGNNSMIHRALELVSPGQVIVVDGGGDVSRALIGEIVARLAARRGVAGLVIDGAVRDVAALALAELPVFAKAACLRGPYKDGPGDLNVAVSIAGMVVNPGDIVVGDADGVVALPWEIGPRILQQALAQQEREAAILESIANGTYTTGH